MIVVTGVESPQIYGDDAAASGDEAGSGTDEGSTSGTEDDSHSE
jgi:hypothetical protein